MKTIHSQSLWVAALLVGLTAHLLGACSMAAFFDGSYFDQAPTPDELGFIPIGENFGTAAVVYTSSSLEDNLGLVNPSNPSVGTWREYAQWIGWLRSNLNDGITRSPETGGPGASSGWSTASADPSVNLPAWVLYDFRRPVPIKTIGLFPRTDRPSGLASNMPQDFSFWTANEVNLAFIVENSETVYANGVNEAVWTRVLNVYEDATQTVFADGQIVHSGNSFPPNPQEQLYVFATPRTARYLLLYITRAGGNFVQMTEMAVYGP